MRRLFYISLLVQITVSTSLCSVKLYGFIENDSACNMVQFAKVTLDDSLEAYTDVRGYFNFVDVVKGVHTIKVEHDKFNPIADTIVIKNDIEDYRYVAALVPKEIHLKMPKSIEKYTKYFSEKDSNEILEITIDSSKFGPQGLELYSSVVNKTDSTLYLIRDFKLNRRIKRYVWNSSGEIVKNTSVYIDFLDCETILGVTSADVVEVPPGNKINYPVILFPLYEFYKLPQDIYRIQIEYEYTQETKEYALNKRLYGYNNFNMSSFFNIALTGKYMSKNAIFVDNSEEIKKVVK